MGSKHGVVALGLLAAGLASGCALISGLSDVGVCASGCDDGGADVASGDAKPADGQSMDVQDSGEPDTGWEAGPPVPCSTSPGACVAGIPPGWSLVTTGGTCPMNFNPGTFVTGATAPPNACGCACSVATMPTCPATFSYAEGPSCATTGLTANAGACFKLSDAYIKMSAPSASGGSCSPNRSVKVAATKTTTFACTPPTACQEELCLGTLQGLPSCIVHEGAAQCPAPFQKQSTVGTDATIDCSQGSCTCSLSSSCATTGAAYSQGCPGQGTAFQADGVCHMLPNDYVKVSFQPSAQCNVNQATFNGQANLTGTKTLCCR